ncbi:MAG: terminase small subunit [Rhizobiaceae bacterium]
MPRLKPRHERFCRAFVECTNATLAAKSAGYAPASARNTGYRLLQSPRITARITEIQQDTAQSHCRNVDVLLGKLETIYRRAIDDHHFSAAARAVELQAKLAGVAPPTAAAARGRAAVPGETAPHRGSAELPADDAAASPARR